MSSLRGWTVKPLDQLAETALGKMLDRGQSRGLVQVPYLRNVNVQWDRIDTSDLFTMELADHERERFGVRTGDLLVCEGGEVGRAAIWNGRGEYLAYQKALHRIRSRGDLDLKFLRYLLEHYRNNGTLARYSTGSTIAHLPQQKLQALPVPHPPLIKQKRIVEILDDHFSRLNASASYLKAAQPFVDSIGVSMLKRHSLLVDAEARPLGELLERPLSNGRSVPSMIGGFPVLRLTALSAAGIDLSQRKSGAWTAEEARPFLIKQGDFLVSRGNGTLKLVGRGGLVREKPDAVAYPDTLIRVRVDESLIHPEYLALMWNSPVVRTQLESMARTTAGIYKVNQHHLRSVRFPVPPLDAQCRVSEDLLALRESSVNLGAALQDCEARASSLRRSLMDAAFSGRLTGRTTNDEIIGELTGV